ncbi:hypothetical protein [Neisseria polysaccharea]|nr:hypothetical protein [Neisseria polysaccharea]
MPSEDSDGLLFFPAIGVAVEEDAADASNKQGGAPHFPNVVVLAPRLIGTGIFFWRFDMSDKKRPIGRPTTYNQETADKICELIARGMSLRAICASADMPAGGTVHRWLAEHQDFQEQYARAREEQADGFADEIIDIADSVAPETGEVAKAKLQIDARKWKAAKLAPKKYGEKLELDADMRVKVETRSLEDIFK